MNGVVFQISEAMITVRDGPAEANQLKSGPITGSQDSQLLTYPVVMSNA